MESFSWRYSVWSSSITFTTAAAKLEGLRPEGRRQARRQVALVELHQGHLGVAAAQAAGAAGPGLHQGAPVQPGHRLYPARA